MTNNVFLGPDAQIQFSLQTLRAKETSGQISGEITDIQDGVFVSNDPNAGVTGEYRAGKNDLVSIRMAPSGSDTSRWQALHIQMGPSDLSSAGVFGVVARSRAPSATVTRLCLRSGRDGQFIDTFFPKAMASFSDPSTHLDVIELDHMSDVPKTADWREFILFFRAGSVEIDLLDLRPFIV